MKKKLCLLLILFFSYGLHAQRFYTLDDDGPYIDSLTQVIKSTKSDSIRGISSFKLADLFRRSKKNELSDQYLLMANKIAPKYPFLKAVAIYYNAAGLVSKGDFDNYAKQLKLADSELKKYKTKDSYVLRAFILKNLSLVYVLQNNEVEGMKVLVNEAIPLAKKGGDLEVLSILYKSVAVIFMNSEERVKANSYLKTAKEYIEQANTSSYSYLETKADIYIVDVENLCFLTMTAEAKKSLDKAYNIIKKHPNSNLSGSYYTAEGYYFYKIGQFNNSLKSYDKGIVNSTLHKDVLLTNRLKFSKYLPLKAMNRLEDAKDLLLDLIGTTTNFAIDQRNFTKELAFIYEGLGDTKNAYKYLSKYTAINDSLNISESKGKIAALEAKFNKVENEKKISMLEAQRERDRLVAQNNKLYYSLLFAILVILLLLVIFLWINSKNQKKIAAQQSQNYTQNIESLKNQKEIDVMQAMIRGEEDERKRIARDLHDGIGSMLSSLKIRFLKVSKSSEPAPPIEIENINNLLNNSITELRQISFNLIPETLLKLGLEHALSDLCHMLETDEIHIYFQSNEIKNNIPENIQIMIYRIVQELLNNALKHSSCTEILVDCSQNESQFYITVEDNGIGFDTTQINDFTGQGLKNLKNRVELLSGKMDIHSSQKNSTIFNIELSI
ncbi:sensor histidine kinase [Chryseobacterium sp. ISL-6]|uniref:sensor histidine kinase n=1 Tax=Chryseobacterium sp. ISL-6 TaxID=2819143 RepID=UPI001BE65932|nr:sensor histidine kinase [Chryseobacterium sp. ISL-6]MBT2619867.1 sensor histidine kinase [Chryseobacterium sp. ISL-6]